jgi:hypothetical protein
VKVSVSNIAIGARFYEINSFVTVVPVRKDEI